MVFIPMSDTDNDVNIIGEITPAFDSSDWIIDVEEYRQKKNERREAGYQSDCSEESSNEVVETTRGFLGAGPSTRPIGTFGETDRGRKRHTGTLGVLGERFVENLVRKYSKSSFRLVREIFQFVGHTNIHKEIASIHRSLQDKGTFHAIIRHDHGESMDHYHVIHACPWKWNQCRCYYISQRRKTRTVLISKIEREGWYDIFKYYSTNGRLLQYLYCGDIGHRALCGIEFVFPERLENSSQEREMETGSHQNQDVCEQLRLFDSGSSCRQVVQSTSKQQYIIRNPKPEEVEAIILSHITVPIHSICVTNIWNKSKFKFLSPKDPIVTQIIDTIRTQFVHWKFQDYVKYLEVNNPLYECLNGNMSDYYYSIQESIDVISELLTLQLRNYAGQEGIPIDKAIQEFLTIVYNVCEKLVPKKNCIEIIGEASSGKSYFCDMVCNFYINVGHVKNFVKNESFPLQSAYNRRILLWNECQFETCATDSVKLLLGGDPCPANIKYEDMKTIQRTPVFITANTQYVPRTPPFNDRMYRYKWSTAQFLKDHKLKPHPACLPALLEYYNVI